MSKLRQLGTGLNKVSNSIKKNGLQQTLQTVFRRVKAQYSEITVNEQIREKIESLYSDLAKTIEDRHLKGIAIITSAMEFEEVYNQRTINLAKHLSEKGYAVIYVAWQWEPEERLQKSYQHVYNNIIQLPLYDFYGTLSALGKFSEIENKNYFITFPAKLFVQTIPPFKEHNFKVVYDNMDEWEEFQKVGHAPWYNRNNEEVLVDKSDLVFVVSEPLKEKFSHIRQDIMVVGNGYNEALAGEKDIALRKTADDHRIHVGYFGHLTDSWIDWDIIMEVAKDQNYFVHLIGYGIPERLEKEIVDLENIKYYGKVHPSMLASHVKNWHVGLIPFKKSKLSQAVDPIKIYEYLYFGLPTVSSGIPHIGKYPFVTHCENANEFKAAINDWYEFILTGEEKDEEIREAFLQATTWDKRFEFMLKQLDKLPNE